MKKSAQFNISSMPEDNDLIPEANQISHAKLRQVIMDLFNFNDFYLLCVDLKVNFDELGGPGDPLSIRVAKLIEYFHRRQRLRLLLASLREKRPALTWEQVLLDAGEEAITPAALTVLAVSEAHPTSDMAVANRSFMALFQLLRRPETRESVISFQRDFEAASAQIDRMNDYKLVHDLFQELENRYFLIENDRKRLPGDESAWDSLALNEPELTVKLDDLLSTTRQTVFAAEAARWLQQLENVKVGVKTAVAHYDLDTLNKAVRLLYRVINRQPSRINAQLILAANTLRLDSLEKAITAICQSIDTSDLNAELELVTHIKAGAGALGGIENSLSLLTSEHNAWQAIDDELRRVEATLDNGIEELEDAWYDLEPMTHNLIKGCDDEWAVDINDVILSLASAIAEGIIIQARRLFRRLRSQTGRRFRQVDLELLTLCHNLQKVGESLDLLLGTIK